MLKAQCNQHKSQELYQSQSITLSPQKGNAEKRHLASLPPVKMSIYLEVTFIRFKKYIGIRVN